MKPPMVGLSPRVRGNRGVRLRRRARGGSIPACAGEPLSTSSPSTLRTVYPRVCGGTYTSSISRSRLTGLSPRVRGNPHQHLRAGPLHRSIPACAGEPVPCACARYGWWVYPRVCGGTGVSQLAALVEHGLSPRVRGNRADGYFYLDGCGSIPACAGEPDHRSGLRLPGEVYPRVCGGTQLRCGALFHRGGLSPRVRGNPAPVKREPVLAGSIPACAGEPWWRAAPIRRTRVYPRVCGGT